MKYKKTLFQTHPHLENEWAETNTLDPSRLTYGSNFKAEWVCPKNHKWSAVISKRTAGRGCPYCNNKRVGFGNSLNLDILRNFPSFS
tara:strand:+ start:178 stop:438 length:261 start_codon:yes stop_codon:yes gene_type:complete